MKITNPHRQKQIKEFIGKEHKVMTGYYDALEASPSRSQLKRKMKELIKNDPLFFDPYLVLADLLLKERKDKESEDLIKKAYQRAVKQIVDKKGNWPKAMMWGVLDNRHIMRAIERYAYLIWEEGNKKEVLEIFRKLLQVNPNDNQGVRYAILAMRLGLGPDWSEQFSVKEGPMASRAMDGRVVDWFDKNAKKFPDDFDWLFKKWEEEDT